MNKLKRICNAYEFFIIKRCHVVHRFYRFYNENLDFRSEYLKRKAELVSGLKFIGQGSTCEVYLYEDYVVKLHVPYKSKFIKMNTLKNNPTRELLDTCDKYTEPCDETNMFNPAYIKYFLFLEYMTGRGLSGIQKYVDCSNEGQLKAYKLFEDINPLIVKEIKLNNMGMDKDKPVIIDWW